MKPHQSNSLTDKTAEYLMAVERNEQAKVPHKHRRQFECENANKELLKAEVEARHA